jgi:hypothetical protein
MVLLSGMHIEADEQQAGELRPIASFRSSYCENKIARQSSAMQESRVENSESMHAIIRVQNMTRYPINEIHYV